MYHAEEDHPDLDTQTPWTLHTNIRTNRTYLQFGRDKPTPRYALATPTKHHHNFDDSSNQFKLRGGLRSQEPRP